MLKNILVISDDYWHPAEVVERGMAFLKSRFSLDFIRDAKDILTPRMLTEYDAVVNCKSNQINGSNDHPWFDSTAETQPKDFEEYVCAGGGFLSVHAGNAFAKEDTSGYVHFVGNYFVQHPPLCDVGVQVLKEHPVTQGVSDFTVRDEHYELAVVAEDANILLRTHSETGASQIGGYVREPGKGRLCVLAPGHVAGVWREPMFQRLLENALCWCTRL